MKLQSHYQRAIVATLLAALTLSAVAPAAWAGQGRGRWQKHRRGGVVVQRVTMSHRSDSFGPAIAGFIGGLALGAVLNNAGSSSAQACEGPRGQSRADFYYWDPYCHERYSSLDAYGSHLRHGCGHPRVVRVISRSSGDCMRSMRFHDGNWRDYDRGDRDDRNDRDYRDDGDDRDNGDWRDRSDDGQDDDEYDRRDDRGDYRR